jgi:crossover junction endodeoxyribonuclease RuvC
MSIILGIDPGLDGGLVWMRDDCKIMAAHPMPCTFETYKKSTKRFIDQHELLALLNRNPYDQAVIEKVSASPQMGVTSAFSFGRGYGTLLGCLAFRGKRTVKASPSKWKADLGCTSDKKQTIRRAIWMEDGGLLTHNAFGQNNVMALRKNDTKLPPFDVKDFHEGCVEAALMAYWHLAK